jgi:uncharacterized protein (UPF0276 family)
MNGLASLPTLGVGASLSLGARPDPVRLVQAPGGPRFVEYAGRVDVDEVVEEVTRIRAAGAPVLFHPSYINFCGSAPNSPDWLAETARHVTTVGSPWFAQDCAYCFWEDGYGYSTQLGYFVPPVYSEASLAAAVERVREVQAAVPVPVAIEPPPVTFQVGRMPVFEFFGRLATAADSALLLDVGHLVSHEVASGKPVLELLAALPRERVVEVHIAGGRMERGVYVDAHDRPILPAAWQLLAELLPHLPELRAVCFECEGAGEKDVLAVLKRLRGLVQARSSHAELVARA